MEEIASGERGPVDEPRLDVRPAERHLPLIRQRRAGASRQRAPEGHMHLVGGGLRENSANLPIYCLSFISLKV